MARHEEDREDLLAEAAALVERVALSTPGDSQPVVVGFRKNGAASFYFGADQAYHFASDAKLRRAFTDGFLFKAERGRLVSLERRRAAGQVQLVRRELDAAETERFLAAMRSRLSGLQQAIAAGKCEVVGQFPERTEIVARVQAWLRELPGRVSLAASPRVQ